MHDGAATQTAESGTLDLDALIAVARRVEAVIGRPLPGQVMKAGPRLRRFAHDDARRAVG